MWGWQEGWKAREAPWTWGWTTEASSTLCGLVGAVPGMASSQNEGQQGHEDLESVP